MKSIVEKLKLSKFEKRVVLNKPEAHYLADLPSAETVFPKQAVDLLFVFVQTMKEFQEIVAKVSATAALKEQGMLYIAYPKKGNQKYETFVHRDEIFPTLKVREEDGYVEGTTLKFNRMVSLDEIFTVVGIKNMPKQQKKTTASASVKDYISFLPEVEAIVSADPEVQAFYHQLTPGYKKEWARYIFSAKQAATQEKRKAEMLTILKQGYKTKALYQQGKK
ncbi:YdeI/OmpD-associated family protein [Enterococcus sp. UD-01]|jgi:hypothetical protein|uniref:YdeI/OmpD-associated family protein n=1 Tax=Enterococcus sp. UD-01 TaxID=3373911 RepID=UPI003837CF29